MKRILIIFICVFLTSCNYNSAEINPSSNNIKPTAVGDEIVSQKGKYYTDGISIFFNENNKITTIYDIRKDNTINQDYSIESFNFINNCIIYKRSDNCIVKISEKSSQVLIYPTEYSYVIDYYVSGDIIYYISGDNSYNQKRLYYYNLVTNKTDFIFYIEGFAANNEFLYIAEAKPGILMNYLYVVKNSEIIPLFDAAKSYNYVSGNIQIDPSDNNIIYFYGDFSTYKEGETLFNLSKNLKNASFDIRTNKITILE